MSPACGTFLCSCLCRALRVRGREGYVSSAFTKDQQLLECVTHNLGVMKAVTLLPEEVMTPPQEKQPSTLHLTSPGDNRLSFNASNVLLIGFGSVRLSAASVSSTSHQQVRVFAGPSTGSLPALVGNDALLQQLLVFANTNGQPVAQLAVVQGVHHLEDVPPTEGQTLRSLLLIIKVGSDEEGISAARHQDVIIG